MQQKKQKELARRLGRVLPEMPIFYLIFMLPMILTWNSYGAFPILWFVALLMLLPLVVLFPLVFFTTQWLFRRYRMPEQVERLRESSVWAAIAYAAFVAGQFAHTFVRPIGLSMLVGFGVGASAMLGLWLFSQKFSNKPARG